MYLFGDVNVLCRYYQILSIPVGQILLPLEKGRRQNWSCSASHKQWLSWQQGPAAHCSSTPCRKHTLVLQEHRSGKPGPG